MTEKSDATSKHLLVRAARGEEVERPPVWAMRQAGRWDPEFQALRAGMSFYEFSEDVELSARASLLPRRFGVDAIILFYDITTLAVAMGMDFDLKPGAGPVPSQPIREAADVERLDQRPDPVRFGHIVELLDVVRAELDETLPVIVFAGAPFTLATYCLATGKDIEATRAFIHERPAVWEALLRRLSTATTHFLSVLTGEGADVYQLFDSWAGMLTEDEYRRWADPFHREIFAAVTAIPRILFVKECPHLDIMAGSGADVISLGARHSLSQTRQKYPDLVFQGNVDSELMRTGTPQQVREATLRCVAEGGGRRHIVNLSHGMDRAAPVENFLAYVRTVRGA